MRQIKIQKKMLRQEREWCKKHPYTEWYETVEDYKIRLRKTALRMPEKDINSAMVGTNRALRDVIDAKGGHIKSD